MDILYVVLALVAVVELIRSKGYIGSIVVVVLLVLAIIFNASMSKNACQNADRSDHEPGNCV